MEKNLKFTKKELFLVAALCCSATALWPDTINSVSLPGIYEEFADASPLLQSYIVSGGFFVSIPVLLIVSAISDKVSKKGMLLFSIALSVIGGTGGAFANNLAMFAVFRSMACASSGIIMSAAYSLIFENFPGNQNSAKILGVFMTFNMAYGTVLGLIAGAVYNFGWRATQFLNAIPVVSIVMIALFVPKGSGQQSQSSQSSEPETTSLEKNDTKRLIHAMVEMAVFHCLCFVYYYFVSLYANERGIGTAAVLGILASGLTAGAIIVNILFAKLYALMGRYFGVVAAFGVGIATVILGYDVPTWMVIALTVFIGICCGGMSTFFPLSINQYVAASNMMRMQAIMQSVSLGVLALCSYIPPAIMSVFSCGYQRSIMIVGFIVTVLAVVDVIILKIAIIPGKEKV